ncbi:MAG: hypothetical protein SCARUB_01892 [Candidatus Scalindua rubra]|uniref:Protein argonaute n=1 Tax=Candidatus Scalindua rubra TaxID=1872076 RepID=A0A1E3XBH6_9BACT|nr:MAG: hypothetical protein SCARUB_01892 [Candidatus Scalindua rubra]
MNIKRKNTTKEYSWKVPSFECGVLSEPLLAFGSQHQHIDPKTGLALYGSYSLVGQDKPSITSIILGIVGPPSMISDAEQWLRSCKNIVTNEGKEPFLYPHFPGINTGLPFQCELIFGDTWREQIKQEEITKAIDIINFNAKIKRIVELYIEAIEILSQREPKPDVILCCIPQEVIEYCTKKNIDGVNRRIKLSRKERKVLKEAKMGQKFFPFPKDYRVLKMEDEYLPYENLYRGLKTEVMRFSIPTQLIWPKTLQLIDQKEKSKRSTQDAATRAWNFFTGIYHKAGGSPWRLAEIESGVCFVGISFYRDLHEKNTTLRTSLAQAFTSAGDGYVLRGNTFEWEDDEKSKSPHLDYTSAYSLITDVIDLYKRQNRGSLPNRIVVHKSSRFWEDEHKGFEDACENIPRKDFVAFGWRGVQFYRPGTYPPLRGTYIKFSECNFLLYLLGYIPFLRSYPGPRAPQPIEILEHHGDSPWDTVLTEILALTKMNWNTADFACGKPVTLAFSRKVGLILAELPKYQKPKEEYRFYM